jgi:Nucleotidyl transferase AbiEii toxin, Type IV TA system
LDILPAAQRRLWPELVAVPDEFVLYGGTALALHLGHRDSVDFDFFGRVALNVQSLENNVPFMSGARVFYRDKNTLSAIVHRGGPVQVSFFGVPKIKQVRVPHVAPDNRLKIASLLDLAGTKASVIQLPSEPKDYIDIDALIRLGKASLPQALASAGKIYGASFNPEITLKALSYFEDEGVKEAHSGDGAHSVDCGTHHLVRATGTGIGEADPIHGVCHGQCAAGGHARVASLCVG